MRARAATLALAFLGMALAGCLSTPQPGAPGPDVPPGAQPLFRDVQVTTRNGPASEVTVAVNPTDPRNLVGGAKDYTLGADPGPGCPEYNVWSGLYWSKDGGATWGNALMPGFPGDGNQTLLSTYLCNSDPVVVFGPDGTAYYSGLAYGGGGSSAGGTGVCPGEAEPVCGRSIWIARSVDGGETWSDFVNIATSDDQQTILDKQWFAVDPNDPQSLVMAWITFAGVGGTFNIAASFDGGVVWTPSLPLAEVDLPVHQFIMPQFGPDGTVYVIWRNFGAVGAPGLPPLPAPLPVGSPGAAQIMFTKNVPGTPGFAPATGIAPVSDINMEDVEFRHASYPVLAVDTTDSPHRGTLYVAWPDEVEGQSDIKLIKSTDGGATWSAPVTVNQDGTDADQFMTWITVDEEGGVVLAYYDRSHSPERLMDMTVTRSVDGGATFRSVRVSNQSWAVPEGCYHQAGFQFLGDYIGVAAHGGFVHPFWADGRTGRCEVFTAAVPYSAFGQGNATAPPAIGARPSPHAAATTAMYSASP